MDWFFEINGKFLGYFSDEDNYNLVEDISYALPINTVGVADYYFRSISSIDSDLDIKLIAV